MSLLGLPLLITTGALAAVAVVALALVWRRLRGGWRVFRVLGIVVCQLLAVAVVGLMVNRSDGFYPSWQALFGEGQPRISTQQSGAALTGWLDRQSERGRSSGLAFAWHTEDVSAWHLSAAATVLLPRAYFLAPTRALPVVVVLAGAGSQGWNSVSATPQPAAITVFVPVASGTDDRLAQLPSQLSADLRVAPAQWGLIGVGSAAPIALDLFGRAGQFGSLALAGGPYPAAATVARGRPLLISAPDPATMLRWVDAQLPPALNPPLVAGITQAKRYGS